MSGVGAANPFNPECLSTPLAKGGMAEIWVAANVGRRGADGGPSGGGEIWPEGTRAHSQR